MVVGPNGAGKTNTLRALQFALTGDAGGDRKKADDVYQGIADGEEAYVEIYMRQDDTDIVLRRGLVPSTNLLRIGEQTWTSVGEINAELWRRLGATKKQISDYVFVRQRKIDDMFDLPPAERAESLAALFGLEHAERVYKKAGEFIGAVEIPTTTTNIAELERTIAEQERTVLALSEQQEQLVLGFDPHKRLAALERDIQHYQTLQQTRSYIEQVRADISSKQAEVTVLQRAQSDLDQYIADLDAGIAALDSAGTAARAALTQWHSYHNASQLRAQLAADIAQHEKQYAGLQEPQVPECIELSAQELQMRDAMAQRSFELQSLLDAMGTTCTCPTCGQRLPDAANQEKLRAERTAELEEIKATVQALTMRHNAWTQYREKLRVYSEQKTAGERERAQLKQREVSLQHFEQPTLAEADCRATLDEIANFQRVLLSLQAEKQDKAKALHRAEGELDSMHTQLRNAESTVSSQPNISQQNYSQMVADRDALLAALETSWALQRQIATADASLLASREKLQDAQRVLAAGTKTRAAVEHLTRVRQLFHRSEAPRVVTYTYIEAMLNDVNKTLELFDAPYRVVMDDNLGFTAHFLDGVRVQPDRRLSVGERIVLAMAFRITVNSTFANRVGMLIMDEPTAGLDEHNLGCLPHALERLRELSAQRGLQVIFVTHEPRIEQFFDNTIELSAA